MATQNAKSEVKIWQWLLSLLQWFRSEGMSSDETSVEAMEIAYHVKIPLWHHNIDEYMDLIDGECKLPAQAIFLRSRARPVQCIRGKGQLISVQDVILGLPSELYNASWLRQLDNHYCQVTLCVTQKQFEWMDIQIKLRGVANGHR